MAVVAFLHTVLQCGRAFLERRRPDPLADQGSAAVGLRPGGAAGPFRAGQAGGLPQRHSRREPPSPLREADAMIIPLEWMPPLMFSGLVVFMLIGYPVSFS